MVRVGPFYPLKLEDNTDEQLEERRLLAANALQVWAEHHEKLSKHLLEVVAEIARRRGDI